MNNKEAYFITKKNYEICAMWLAYQLIRRI